MIHLACLYCSAPLPNGRRRGGVCIAPACCAQRDAALKARIDARRHAAQELAAVRKAARRAAKGNDGGGSWPSDEALRADNRRAGERELRAAAERVSTGACALGCGE